MSRRNTGRNHTTDHKDTILSNDDILKCAVIAATLSEEEERKNKENGKQETAWHPVQTQVTHAKPQVMKADTRPRIFSYQEFLTALEKSGSTGIETPVPDPFMRYDPIDLMNNEYKHRHQYLSAYQLKKLWIFVPICVILSFTLGGRIMAIVLMLIWWFSSVKNTKKENEIDIAWECKYAPVADEIVNRMRRIDLIRPGRILESDAAREVIFARQYYKRYLNNHVIDEREYRILMAPFEDEAKDIGKRAEQNPDGTMAKNVDMTTLFRYRLDPFVMSDEK